MSSVNKKSITQKIKDKIDAGKIATKLQNHINDPDNTPMAATQINAARILLGKVCPDLKAVEQTIKDERKKTKEEIYARLKSLGLNPDEVWQSVSKH